MTSQVDQPKTDVTGGLQFTSTLQTESGYKYQIVQLSRWSAAVVVDGADNLSLTIMPEGSGDVGAVIAEKVSVGGIVEAGCAIFNAVNKAMGGSTQCHTQNQQSATFDPKTGNMTSFTNTTTVVCTQT